MKIFSPSFIQRCNAVTRRLSQAKSQPEVNSLDVMKRSTAILNFRNMNISELSKDICTKFAGTSTGYRKCLKAANERNVCIIEL